MNGVAASDIASRALEAGRSEPALRRVPGEGGVWLLVGGDMAVFALLFLSFLYYRSQSSALYAASQLALSQGRGVANTVFLLTSSWLVASAVHQARRVHGRRPIAQIAAAMLMGTAFGASKIMEWRHVASGLSPLHNDFFTFYFMLTGIHFVHFLIGMGLLGHLLWLLRRPGWSEARSAAIESCGVFWHMVDLLWLVLFALLYLAR
ncbi:MAG TPA: cytochrome c oxidase subunit 3 [Steroidobacter sp.]|jgi:nitric oxide reductase NorE protein|nr:cytochrome c oxidase subunit 3 [Steroidobacter sp.]